MHTIIVNSNAGTKGIPNHAINVTLNIAPNVATEAKERSNNPAENAKVAPKAMIVVMDIERKMLMKLAVLKKTRGAAIEKMTIAMAIAATTPQSAMNFAGVIF